MRDNVKDGDFSKSRMNNATDKVVKSFLGNNNLVLNRQSGVQTSSKSPYLTKVSAKNIGTICIYRE